MPGANMQDTSCHPNCGCNVTSYIGCCLECPLKECYFVDPSVKSRILVTEFQVQMKDRRKEVRSLLKQGLSVREVMSRTGLTRGKVDWAGICS